MANILQSFQKSTVTIIDFTALSKKEILESTCVSLEVIEDKANSDVEKIKNKKVVFFELIGISAQVLQKRKVSTPRIESSRSEDWAVC